MIPPAARSDPAPFPLTRRHHHRRPRGGAAPTVLEAYYDKSGTNLFQTTLTGFWGPLADPSIVSHVFDPRVVWDHYLGRFILVGVGDTKASIGHTCTPTCGSYYFVAVSNSSIPSDGW